MSDPRAAVSRSNRARSKIVKRSAAGHGRTHAERRREAETRILKAAFDIIAKRGLDHLTLADAGQQAGYSRGSRPTISAVAKNCSPR